jgi:hypothetical protein
MRNFCHKNFCRGLHIHYWHQLSDKSIGLIASEKISKVSTNQKQESLMVVMFLAESKQNKEILRIVFVILGRYGCSITKKA